MGKIHGAGRHSKTTFDHGFELRFVERCYDACERWYNDEVWPLIGVVAGDNHGLLDREKRVKHTIIEAHDSATLYGPSSCYLLTCVNPTCGLRSWELVDFASGEHTIVTSEQEPSTESLDGLPTQQVIKEDIRAQLKAMARGSPDDLKFNCRECGGKQALFSLISVSDKWIYVLKEAGQSLDPVWQIYVESDEEGYAQAWRGGRFSESSVPYNGKLILTRALLNETLHFFLSPVKLGPKALDMLRQSPQNQARYNGSVKQANPGLYRVPVMPNLQPWAATLKRRFNKRQFPTLYEFIPLVDPFGWASTAVEADYVPVLNAQRHLATDENEQAKLFVASTLAKAVSAPPSFDPSKAGAGSGDPLKVKKVLAAGPAYKSASNVAEAWVTRYGDVTEYLAKAVNYACCRVFFPALFAPGHRIVESACQEQMDDPEFLQHGLLHWHMLLRDALACQAGKEFVKSLVRNDAVADRIPRANVLRSEGLKRNSKYRQKFGIAVPAQILGSLIAVVIATESTPAKSVAEYLKNAAGESYFPGDDEIDGLKEAIDVAAERLPKKFFKHFMEQVESGTLPVNKTDRWWRYQGAVKTLGALLTIWGLGVRWKKYVSSGGDSEGKWEHWDAWRGAYIETPSVGAKLVADWRKEALEKRLKNFEFAGGGTVLKEDAVAFDHAELGMKSAKRGLYILEGPIGLVTAVLDLVSETNLSIDASRAGDTGAAVGHGIEAAGALVALAPAVAYTAALFTSAEVAAWAGPVGWVASALMVTGALAVAFLSLSDLAIFAKHCFLGDEYGSGEVEEKTGKQWMSDRGWGWLRYEEGSSAETEDRFLRQQAVLLRMFCQFEVMVGTMQFAGGDIRTNGWVPDGGIFQVEVTLRPTGKSDPSKTYRANILPSTQTCRWTGEMPADSDVRFNFSQTGKLESIHVSAIPPFAKTDLDAVFRVKLQLDTSGKFTVPAKGWVEGSTYRQGLVSSAGGA